MTASRRPGPDIEAFEALEFDVERFDHEAHVYVAWQYVRSLDLLTAIGRYRDTLIRLTEKLGVPDKYHETITWFYLVAVSEGATGQCRDDWATFRRLNPTLFEREPGAIRRHYSPARLMSPAARQTFVLPDLAG